jgi:hypothetical protein
MRRTHPIGQSLIFHSLTKSLVDDGMKRSPGHTVKRLKFYKPSKQPPHLIGYGFKLSSFNPHLEVYGPPFRGSIGQVEPPFNINQTQPTFSSEKYPHGHEDKLDQVQRRLPDYKTPQPFHKRPFQSATAHD